MPFSIRNGGNDDDSRGLRRSKRGHECKAHLFYREECHRGGNWLAYLRDRIGDRRDQNRRMLLGQRTHSGLFYTSRRDGWRGVKRYSFFSFFSFPLRALHLFNKILCLCYTRVSLTSVICRYALVVDAKIRILRTVAENVYEYFRSRYRFT